MSCLFSCIKPCSCCVCRYGKPLEARWQSLQTISRIQREREGGCILLSVRLMTWWQQLTCFRNLRDNPQLVNQHAQTRHPSLVRYFCRTVRTHFLSVNSRSPKCPGRSDTLTPSDFVRYDVSGRSSGILGQTLISFEEFLFCTWRQELGFQ